MVVAAGSSAFDQPGTLGFLVVFGMAVVLYFVFRSMAKHLRRVNAAAQAEASSSDADAATIAPAPDAAPAALAPARPGQGGPARASAAQAGHAPPPQDGSEPR